MGKYVPLTEEDKDRIVRLYTGQTKAGPCTVNTVAKLLSIGPKRVKAVLGERGIPLRPPVNPSLAETDYMLQRRQRREAAQPRTAGQMRSLAIHRAVNGQAVNPAY